jgi:lysophospholipase L1-like esterase
MNSFFLSGLPLLFALAANAQSRKLLPLGDSITWGCGDTCEHDDHEYCDGDYGDNYTCCAVPFGSPVALPWTPCFGCSGGYRAPLLRMLNASTGYAWESVGTLSQDKAIAPWAAHDGHPGWRVDQLYNETGGNLSFFANWTRLQPDLVLIMAGTNDIGQVYELDCNKTVRPWACSVDNLLARMDTLLSKALHALPHSHLFVSDILGIGPQPCYGPEPYTVGDPLVHAFNAGLGALATKYERVTHIPLQTITNIGDGGHGLCPCQYHPTHETYAVIAEVFASAILATVGESPTVVHATKFNAAGGESAAGGAKRIEVLVQGDTRGESIQSVHM